MTTVSDRAKVLFAKGKPTLEQVEAALKNERVLAVQEAMSIRDVANHFGVATSTINTRMKTLKKGEVIKNGRTKYILPETLHKLAPRNDFGPMKGRVAWLHSVDSGDPCQVIWYDEFDKPQVRRGVVESVTSYNIIVSIDGVEDTTTFYRRTGGEFFDPVNDRGKYHLYPLGALPDRLVGVIEPISE